MYNCDFVESYLDQLGLYGGVTFKSHVLLRLTFTDGAARVIDQSTLFLAGGFEFRPALPFDGPLFILAPGDALPTSGNYARLVAMGETTWVVDIVVNAPAGAELDDGESMSLDRTVVGLSSAVALGGLQSGMPPTRVADLAARARFNTHSMSPNTRAGVLGGINRIFPDIKTLGCTVSGDSEMVRDAVNPAAVVSGKMDVLVRGDALYTDTVSIRLNYIDTGAGYKFVGELILPEVAVEVASLVQGDTEISDYDLVSVSSSPSTHPGLSAAYGDKERLFVIFDMPEDVDQNELIVPLVDETGDDPIYYATFAVTYRYDPLMKVVASVFEGDYAPVGVDTYIRYFNPVRVNTLNVVYNRWAGRSLNLTAAREEILQKLNRYSHHTPAGAADVVDSVCFAGAHSVDKIEVDATVRFSCASHVYVGVSPPTAEILESIAYAALMNEVEAIPHAPVLSFIEPEFNHTAGVNQSGAVGDRSVSWLLESSDLLFTENRTLG